MPRKRTTWIGFAVILIAGAFSSISLFQARAKFLPSGSQFQIATIGFYASLVAVGLAIPLMYYFNEKEDSKKKNGKGTIMVVDDDDSVRTLLKSILSDAGYGVVSAINGQEAVRMLPNIDAQLVLLDTNMPGLNGFQTLEQIRRQSAIPVLMVTGAGDPQPAQPPLKIEADDYVTKPVRPKELLATIEAKLKRS